MKIRERRIQRLKKELTLLESMDDQMFRKMVRNGLLIVPALAASFILLFMKAHGWAAPSALSLAVCLGVAFILFWFWRYSLSVPLIALVLAVAILLEGGIDDWPTGKSRPSKEERRSKLDRAIERRKVLLAKLEAHL